jgi:hypothetical protein
MWERTFDGMFADGRYTLEVFKRHKKEVKEHVPADLLLLYEVKGRWKPLCRFLGVEAPKDKSFPH